MPLTVSEEERNALERAQARSQQVRHWRRYQAVLLRGLGVPVAEVARDLGCSEAQRLQLDSGLADGGTGRCRGGPASGQPAPAARCGSGGGAGRPGGRGRSAGVRLRRRQLDRAAAAYRVGQARLAGRRADHPTHVAPFGVEMETAQVCPGTTRPGVRGEKKPSHSKQQRMVAAGGEVWFGDETTLREFPPLRAAWAKRGQQQIVVISGRNARRVVHGALNVATGEFASLIRERSRQDDCAAFVDALGQRAPACAETAGVG